MSAWACLFIAVCNFLSAVICALQVPTQPNKLLLVVLWFVAGLLMTFAYITKRRERVG